MHVCIKGTLTCKYTHHNSQVRPSQAQNLCCGVLRRSLNHPLKGFKYNFILLDVKRSRILGRTEMDCITNIRFAIQHIVLHACALMTVLVREFEESLLGRLGCKLEAKSKLDYTTVGKEGMDWVHMDKVRDSTENCEPSRS